jgi:hypothetical protein
LEKSGVITDEGQTELRWAQNRPGSQSFGQEPLTAWTDEDASYQALTSTEVNYYDNYNAMWPNQAWSLNQDPLSGRGMKSQDQFLQTLIHNMHLVFADIVEGSDRRSEPRRWLFATEALTTQGFPVKPGQLEEGEKLCSFNYQRASRTPRAVCGHLGLFSVILYFVAVVFVVICNSCFMFVVFLRPKQLQGQVGNSMSLLVIMVSELHGLVSWIATPPPALLSNVMWMRKALIRKHQAEVDEEECEKRRRMRTRISGKSSASMLEWKDASASVTRRASALVLVPAMRIFALGSGSALSSSEDQDLL